MQLPIDTSQLSFIVMRDPEPATDRGGNPKLDRATGRPLFQVSLALVGTADAEVVKVKLPVLPKVSIGDQVRAIGLTLDLFQGSDSKKGQWAASWNATSIEPTVTKAA